MTISSTIRKAGPYPGNGVTLAFPFPFKVFAASEVLVVLSVAGVVSPLVLGANYLVTLNADQNANPGGTVSLLAPLATGATLTLGSQVANLSPTNLTNAGGFYPSVINDALDRATIQIQQLAETTGRAVALPFATAVGVSAELPTPSANQLLGWNASATSLQNVDPSGFGSGGGSVVTGTTVYASEVKTATAGQMLVVLTTLTYLAGRAGALSVYLNGLRVRKTVDYVETNSSSITFVTPLFAGDEVEFVVGAEVGAPVVATTVTLGATTTGAAGSAAAVTNSGTSTAAVLNFTVPRGADGAGAGSVTAVSVATANGLAGTVANATTTPAITLSVSASGVLKGAGGVLTAATAETDYTSPTGTGTMTNKRITCRVDSAASSATPAINTDLYDVYKLTAQAVAITSMTSGLTGTPTDNQCLIIEITGTAAVAITWGTSFEASTVALPTTTVTTAMLAVAFIWNTASNKWRCVAAV